MADDPNKRAEKMSREGYEQRKQIHPERAVIKESQYDSREIMVSMCGDA